MATDPNRATFVQQEYRYEKAENLSIKATYLSARELVHMTNLTESAADALAEQMLAESGQFAEAYKIEVEGTYRLEDIETAPMRFTVTLPQYGVNGRVLKVSKFECDPLKNRTTFEVRG